MHAGRKYWLQFILLELVVYLLKISLAAFLLLFFPLAGSDFTLFFLIGFRIIFIYLEFTFVEDNVSIPVAVKRCRNNFFKTFYLITELIFFMIFFTDILNFYFSIYWTYV